MDIMKPILSIINGYYETNLLKILFENRILILIIIRLIYIKNLIYFFAINLIFISLSSSSHLSSCPNSRLNPISNIMP